MDEMKQQARRVSLAVSIEGHDVTSALEPCLTSFSYTDHAAKKSDELQLELHNRDGLWSGGWAPQKGARVSAVLRCLDWCEPGKHLSLDCGGFAVDEVEYSGPDPDRVTIKAVSAALTGSLRETECSQGWENYTLEGVAGEIAGRNGLELFYDAPAHSFDRQDQRGEPDLAFVERLSMDRGVHVKVRDNRLILYDAARHDAKGAAMSIVRSGGQFSPSSYSFKRKSEGTAYSACAVSYHDPATGELHTYTYNPTGKASEASTDKVYSIDMRVKSEADAQALARSRLREANKGEVKADMELMGHPGLVAGITVNLSGFGSFDGKYFVEKATHKYSGGYKTSLELRNTLEF